MRSSQRQGLGLAWLCGGGGLVPKLCLTLATLWTVAHQAPLSTGFPRQYWSGLPFPPPGGSSQARLCAFQQFSSPLWACFPVSKVGDGSDQGFFNPSWGTDAFLQMNFLLCFISPPPHSEQMVCFLYPLHQAWLLQ